ncbi:gliding motility-associated C-terminal domain-containing protein [Hymenobacter endophyticus]|uniref:Gliding motility-associated C-terminal domain-containing protein n=1 Tax=Hymenobacter endophyticus TaxID=3076335 RepID=A0ABU3TMQ1_9BACT|nr:gliding motility-associated C-terminal domain-containing protein [Hymenobacter endophyticus]MDU0372662.1 gliding motility-associated C-terminal domain-containing protein [Hymenobacter endophyticus]
MPTELPPPAPVFLPNTAPPGQTCRWRARPTAGWLLPLLLLLLTVVSALGQGTPPPECSQDEKFANTWYFGHKAGLDFNQATDSIPPTVLTDGRMTAPFGSGVMSDGNGRLLFYTNGDTIWNRDHSIMGTGLGGTPRSTDGALAVKKPGSFISQTAPTRYYVFALNDTIGLCYSEIEIPAGGGAGTIISRNNLLARGTAHKLTGVFHKNGCDIWIIAHGWGSAKTGNNNRGDAFLAYRITINGVLPVVNGNPNPVISSVGSLHAPNVARQGYRGQMKVTPDGRQLALARFSEVAGDSSSTVELFSFDTNTGEVSASAQTPFIVDSKEGSYYGVEFSPSQSRLFATVLNPAKLLQFDLRTTNVPASKISVPLKQMPPANLGSMQAAPDGKIYVARENQPALGFIPKPDTFPDSVGFAVDFVEDSLLLNGRRSGLGLPNFNQSSLLRVGFQAELTACRTVKFQAPPIDFDIESYEWTFGDGTTSTDANPVHTYAQPGDYTVKLRITTDCFCRESQGLFRVPGLPEPGSIAADQAVCAGTTPAPFASTAPAIGDPILQIRYQWESSTDNATWADVAGATGSTYQPGNSLPAGTYYFRRRVQLLLSNGNPYCDPTFTASVRLTVTLALVAGSIAADQTVCAGSTAAPLTSSASATGGNGTFAYQWQSSTDNSTWSTIGGATGETYAPGTLTATTLFRRLVSSGPCTAISNTAIITVAPALAAGTIAANQAVCNGAAPNPLTSITPALGGPGPVAYQWESSVDNSTWTAISGAANADYTPGPLTATTYFRRRAISGACGPVYSNVVTLTVAPVLTAGSIAADQTLCSGAIPAPLTSSTDAAGGAGAVTYQWESSVDNTTWATLPGATSATYTPGPLTATTYFRRSATTGNCGPVYSNVVKLTALPTLTAGSIAADQTICNGATPAPLTSSAGAGGGTGTFAYQWESSSDNVSWTAIGGATSDTYTPGPLTRTTYFRRRVASGGCGPEYTASVVITVAPALTAGSIGTNQTLCSGATPAPLSSGGAATGGIVSVTYQWESSADNSSWTPVSGATDATYAPGPLNATTYFRRRATAGACGPVYSNVVTLTVTPAVVAGSIGQDQTVCPGAAPVPLASTTSATGGTGSYTYQWESSPDNTTWTTISGANGATYAPGSLTATTYVRRRVISGSCGPEYSNVVTLTVLPALTAGTITADQDICAGTSPTPLTGGGATGGTGTYGYQWESSLDNSTWAAVSGANDATYAPGPLTATTYFRRRVTSGTGTCATAISNVVTVRVQPRVTPTVTLASPPVECPGTPLTFTAVAANAGPTPAFQWFVNNVAVASGPTFTSSTLVTGDQVRVEVTPSPGLCSTGPAVATVTVTRTPTPAPTLSIAVQPGDPVCLGAPLTFSIASITGAGPAPQYQWQVNGADVVGATGPVFTSTTLREGQLVTLRLRTTNTCAQPVTAISNAIAVRIQPPVNVDAGPDKEVLAGNSVTLEGRADGRYSVRWTPSQTLRFSGDSLKPIASPTVTTTYTLSAGSGGCADSDEVTVVVRPPIRIPNAFTPNGDGRDDTWQIEFIEQFPDNTVTVFNRWGTKIFSANNYGRANEWRGDINGQPAPVGTYYYVVVTKGPLGRSYSGSITILY